MQAISHTLIVMCSTCSGFLLAKSDQKTRTCPYCGHKVNLDRVRKVASAGTASEASRLLRKLKSDVALKRERSKCL